MVGKSQIKLIKSLHQKKYRTQHGLFIVEGIKTVQELLESDLEAYKVYATKNNLLKTDNLEVELISEHELKQISTLKTPNKVLGVFKIPVHEALKMKDWVLALDDVRDPGNLGTIIRLCDWFGISDLICSESTVDCYNPKVIQASMGSITRVTVKYANLFDFLSNTQAPIYGTFMNGEIVYDIDLPSKGVLVMGNEANGISEEIASLINSRIAIPQFGGKNTESLNVATATAIFLSEIRRG